MRLDKFVAQSADVTRSQAKKLIQAQRVTINQQRISNSAQKVTSEDRVFLDNKSLQLMGHRYILLHKPKGYICSTKDEEYPSALNLIDVPNKSKLHFAGRLDQDTTGMVLVSDDGDWTHRVTSPRKRLGKCYHVWLKEPVSSLMISEIESGVALKNEAKKTLPANIKLVSEYEVLLTIDEGKYHQVKRMFAAVGNRVVKLHRESIGEINLDNITEGEYRLLSENEIAKF